MTPSFPSAKLLGTISVSAFPLRFAVRGTVPPSLLRLLQRRGFGAPRRRARPRGLPQRGRRPLRLSVRQLLHLRVGADCNSREDFERGSMRVEATVPDTTP